MRAAWWDVPWWLSFFWHLEHIILWALIYIYLYYLNGRTRIACLMFWSKLICNHATTFQTYCLSYMQFVTIFYVCCVSSNKLLNIAASLHKSVICHCLIGADLNIHVEFKHLFVPKRTVSASFEKNCQRTVRSSWVDRPPFKMFGHPNICLIISKLYPTYSIYYILVLMLKSILL